MKYRKKPIVVEAVQWDGTEVQAETFGFELVGLRMKVDTLEGAIYATKGDYIITGVQGEKYPCKPDIFEATYELVTESMLQLARDPNSIPGNTWEQKLEHVEEKEETTKKQIPSIIAGVEDRTRLYVSGSGEPVESIEDLQATDIRESDDSVSAETLAIECPRCFASPHVSCVKTKKGYSNHPERIAAGALKVRARYPDGFSQEAAQRRADEKPEERFRIWCEKAGISPNDSNARQWYYEAGRLKQGLANVVHVEKKLDEHERGKTFESPPEMQQPGLTAKTRLPFKRALEAVGAKPDCDCCEEYDDKYYTRAHFKQPIPKTEG